MMGNSNSVFNSNQLEEYQILTFLTKKEILIAFNRFKSLVEAAVKDNLTAATKNILDVRLPKVAVIKIHELKENPFRERICDVFSSKGDGSISFEDFLDMMSVFSDAATKKVKVEYAFRIYDFNDDDAISRSDLKQIIDLLTGGQMICNEEMQQLVDNVLKEGDLDGDGALSFAEFQHVLSKTPDFVNSFRIRL